MTSKSFKFLIPYLLLLGYQSAHSGTIQNVKGNRALIVMDGDEFQVADEIFSIDANGKKRAILKVTQVKNGKALTEIVKGKPEIGQTTLSKSAPAMDAASESTVKSKLSNKSWGVLGSFEMDTMSASFTSGTGVSARNVTTSMSGTGFGAYGFYDYPITSSIQAVGIGGIQMYNATGTTALPDCGNATTKNCNFNITYLNLMGGGKYNFNLGNNRAWVGGGIGFLIAASKSSNVVDTATISTNQLYAFQVGYDMKISAKNYVPFMFEYGLFPTSSTVSASVISLRAGWAWNL